MLDQTEFIENEEFSTLNEQLRQIVKKSDDHETKETDNKGILYKALYDFDSQQVNKL